MRFRTYVTTFSLSLHFFTFFFTFSDTFSVCCRIPRDPSAQVFMRSHGFLATSSARFSSSVSLFFLYFLCIPRLLMVADTSSSLSDPLGGFASINGLYLSPFLSYTAYLSSRYSPSFVCLDLMPEDPRKSPDGSTWCIETGFQP